MIPNYANEMINPIQIKMYEWERSLAGTKDLGIYEDSSPLNPHYIISGIFAFPVATIDVLLEDLRPIIKVIEDVVFLSLNLLGSPFRLLLQGSLEAKKAIRGAVHLTYKLVNDVADIFVKIPMSVVFLVAQVAFTFFKPQDAFPCKIQMNPQWVGENYKMDYLDLYSVSHEQQNRYEVKATKPQKVLFKVARGISEKYPLVGRATVALLAVPIAVADAGFIVLKPLFSMVHNIALSALAFFAGVFDLIVIERKDAFQDFNFAFAYLNSAADDTAKLIANIAMSPVTILMQTFSLILNPKNSYTASEAFYSLRNQDVIYGFRGRSEFKRTDDTAEKAKSK